MRSEPTWGGAEGNGTLCRTAEGPKSRPPLRAAMPGPDPRGRGTASHDPRKARGFMCTQGAQRRAAPRSAPEPPRLPSPASSRHGAPRASRRPRHGVTAPPHASRRPCHGVTAAPRLPSPASSRHGAPAPPVAHVMASRRPRASRRPCHRVTAPPRLTSPASWRHGAPAPLVAHVMASRRPPRRPFRRQSH